MFPKHTSHNTLVKFVLHRATFVNQLGYRYRNILARFCRARNCYYTSGPTLATLFAGVQPSTSIISAVKMSFPPSELGAAESVKDCRDYEGVISVNICWNFAFVISETNWSGFREVVWRGKRGDVNIVSAEEHYKKS